MTEQPYRSPAGAADPPDRIETLGLRRYPLAVQAFFLAWFPIVSLITAAAIPSESITCARAIAGRRPACRLEREFLFRAERIPINNTRSAVRAESTERSRGRLIIEPLHKPEEPEVIALNARDAAAIALSYEELFDSPERGVYRRSIRELGWLYLLLAIVEGGIGVFFMVAQKKIFLDSNADTGVVRIAQGSRFGPIVEDDLALGDVDAFSVDEHESNIRRGRVSATMHGGDKKVLFDATQAEARRGAKFLEAAHERWKARQG